MRFDSFLEEHLFALKLDVTQSFVIGSHRAIGRFSSRGKPPFIDTATVRAESVKVARIEFQTAAGHKKGTRYPARGQTHDAFAGGERIADKP